VASCTLTPATAPQVLRALYDALGAFDGAGRRNAATVLASQSALETAQWQKLWDYNVGNVTCAAAIRTGLPCCTRGLTFAVYPSLAAGAADMVAFLGKHGGGASASSALGRAAAGDVPGFVARLQAMHYAGDADYAAYERAIAAGVPLLGKLELAPAPWVGVLEALGVALALGAVAVLAVEVTSAPAQRRRARPRLAAA
jgi:hypothetical protein